MLPAGYIKIQPAARRQVLTDLHAIIMAGDKTIAAVVEPMMGKEMIIYKANGMMKYGLSSVKNYMSLHLLPMYASPEILNAYKALLTKASFQKGCINFTDAAVMPLPIVQKLITDCAAIDLLKIMNDYRQSRKTAKQK